VPGQVAKHGSVTCVGYTDLPSRLPAQASTLYSNNISKFLLSMGPFTGHKEHFLVDHGDDAVRWGCWWGARPVMVHCPACAGEVRMHRVSCKWLKAEAGT
jgi:hypothetical protein